MKLNKSITDKLCCLSDEEMWGEIRKMALAYGLRLPEGMPCAEDLKKVRCALDSGQISTRDAMRIVNEYKRGKNNG